MCWILNNWSWCVWSYLESAAFIAKEGSNQWTFESSDTKESIELVDSELFEFIFHVFSIKWSQKKFLGQFRYSTWKRQWKISWFFIYRHLSPGTLIKKILRSTSRPFKISKSEMFSNKYSPHRVHETQNNIFFLNIGTPRIYYICYHFFGSQLLLLWRRLCDFAR